MAEFSIIERMVHRLDENIIQPLLAPCRRRKLNNTDFTIISNNCWGGRVYEYFGLIKNSPTVGAYFYPSDYLLFVENLKHYTSVPIKMISAYESKWREKLAKKGQLDVPIGKIEEIEIVFLHYKDPIVAKDKWERRCRRINYDNLIYKFSQMNGCTDEEIKRFSEITNGKKRVIFTTKKIGNVDDCIIIPPPQKKQLQINEEESGGYQIKNDTFYFNKYIDVVKLING